MLIRSSFLEQAVFISVLPLLYAFISFARKSVDQRRQDVPVVGKPAKWVLPVWRARIQYITQGVEMIRNGYLKVSRAPGFGWRIEIADIRLCATVYRYYLPDTYCQPKPVGSAD